MDYIHQILRSIPLFYPFTDKELASLRGRGIVERIPKGRVLDLKNINSFAAVIKGVFEFESSIKRDALYLFPGAFFGEMPFITKRLRGSVRAMADSEILLFNTGEVYRYFFSVYRGLKGYIRNIKKTGFEMSDPAREHFGNGCRIISVFSKTSGSGKSVFSAFLGMSVSEAASVIIIDASGPGKSVFDIFNHPAPPPVSQKSVEGASSDQMISEAIVKIDKNISLLNFSSGASVKADLEIVSPVLFYLSRIYKYIIIDLSNSDREFAERVLSLSDKIFCMLRSGEEKSLYFDLFDSVLAECQRVYYVINKFYAKGTGSFEGGYIFDDIKTADESLMSGVGNYALGKGDSEIIRLVTSKKTGLVLDANVFEAVLYLPLFYALSNSNRNIDFIYSSSWSFVISAIYVQADFYSDFEKKVSRIFSRERIRSLLDITFPDLYVYKNSKIHRFFREVTGDRRIESYRTIPAAALSDAETGERRMFSTGFFSDLITASFCLYPAFDSFDIGGRKYHNNYYTDITRPQDLFRTDIDEIIFAEVVNKKHLNFPDSGILSYYKNNIDNLNRMRPYASSDYAADKKIEIETDVAEYDPEMIFRMVEDLSKKISV